MLIQVTLTTNKMVQKELTVKTEPSQHCCQWLWFKKIGLFSPNTRWIRTRFDRRLEIMTKMANRRRRAPPPRAGRPGETWADSSPCPTWNKFNKIIDSYSSIHLQVSPHTRGPFTESTGECESDTLANEFLTVYFSASFTYSGDKHRSIDSLSGLLLLSVNRP